MKIKLFYIHPTNYGNLMMACVFIEHFHQIMIDKGKGSPEFYLDVLDDAELYRVKKSLPEGIKIYREHLFDRKRRGIIGKLTKLINIPKEIIYNCKTYDICIVLGGDCISQYYSKQIFISDMLKFRMISKKVPFYLLGQTMGPFHGYGVKLVQKCLKNCKIYLRDYDCFEYINKTFHFPYLYEARDLAFLDIPFQNDSQKKCDLLKQYVGGKPYITIVPSGADRQYTSNISDYIREYIKIIDYLIHTTEYDILLLAHVIHVSDSNDKRIIDQMIKKIDTCYLTRIHVVNFLLLPYEARILLGNGIATITGRMHAAVSSINMGTIPICLSYSVKYKGVIGDDFELNDYIYECRGNEIWAQGKVHAEVIQMLDFVLQNREELLKQIYSKLEIVQKKALGQIYETAKEIENN